jgi:hypothetical protein
MTDRPITLTADEVRAALAGKLTTPFRPMKPQPKDRARVLHIFADRGLADRGTG